MPEMVALHSVLPVGSVSSLVPAAAHKEKMERRSGFNEQQS